MSYKEVLQKQIRELERKIALAGDEKLELQNELNRLKLSEFEEDMRQNPHQQLLQE